MPQPRIESTVVHVYFGKGGASEYSAHLRIVGGKVEHIEHCQIERCTQLGSEVSEVMQEVPAEHVLELATAINAINAKCAGYPF